MPYGQLEVYVANARGLDDTNWLTDMNPYVVVTCRTEEKKSSTASGEGSDPEWNESFLFTITRGCDELHIKLMDENTFQDDDFLGEATISLEEVFREGEVGSTSYQLYKDDEECGSIRLGLTFTREERDECDEDY
ncbi:elicitor-responsive protein 3-like [Nicotiana sylvestris]|uniref:Elicitor-responsive protein 3-like n=1 Tax=Nicotiana sylvestris TaxID=4096 RepID=A0A1U7W9N6_NICSY|nr:PREDICTED: elicitor-responsive protein 3-like [Nicotiana sylvestris]